MSWDLEDKGCVFFQDLISAPMKSEVLGIACLRSHLSDSIRRTSIFTLILFLGPTTIRIKLHVEITWTPKTSCDEDEPVARPKRRKKGKSCNYRFSINNLVTSSIFSLKFPKVNNTRFHLQNHYEDNQRWTPFHIYYLLLGFNRLLIMDFVLILKLWNLLKISDNN